MASGLTVQGYTGLTRAFKLAGKDARVELRVAMQSVAKPVKERAAVLASTEITRMRSSPQWGQMRTGVTQRSVYIAPKQRGTRGRGGRRARPNLGNLLMNRAMLPALEQTKAIAAARLDRVLDEIGKTWERA